MCYFRFVLDRDLETIDCYMTIGDQLGFIMTDMLDVGVTIPVSEFIAMQEGDEGEMDVTEELDMFYDYVVDHDDNDTVDDDDSIIDLTADE